jgi:two-component system, chemotaxis family, protein-glutamate methylesterase/glutaminase
MLPAILSRKTALPVKLPTDGMLIECGTVYAAPPDRHLLIDDGVIRIGRGPRENNFRPAVDPLFRTAAVAYGPAVIGVILSGNLDDGTAGLLAIKQAGGIGIAQDPEDADYPGMPASAVQEVLTLDHIARLQDISALLVDLAGQAGPMMINGGKSVDDIAMGGDSPAMNEERLGNDAISDYGCPSCGGVLWEKRDRNNVRFRCRVGHMFSDEALLAAQTEGLETALWTALRALEEAAEQAGTLAARTAARGHSQLAKRFERQARDAVRRAAIVRQALMLNQGTGERQMPEAV